MEHITRNIRHRTRNIKKERRNHSSFVPRSVSRVPYSAGFALLFAILAVSTLFYIALAIWSISSRAVFFSSLGRESQVAFYAADAGAECALYWDVLNNSFATSVSPSSSVTCAGRQVLVGRGSGNSTSTITNLLLGSSAAGPCFTVEVGKSYAGNTLLTNITSFGHNTCDTTNPLRLERALRVYY